MVKEEARKVLFLALVCYVVVTVVLFLSGYSFFTSNSIAFVATIFVLVGGLALVQFKGLRKEGMKLLQADMK